MSSPYPFWLRSWKLVVTYANKTGSKKLTLGSSADSEALRVTFDVLQVANKSPFWYAVINVYNMSTDLGEDTILNASWAELSAGYDTGPAYRSVIWSGPVFQALFDRENVVDTKYTLHCIANPFDNQSIVSMSVGQFSSQAQLMARMIKTTGLNAFKCGSVTNSALSTKVYPRGNTIFGKTSTYMNQVASDQNLQSWSDGTNMYMDGFTRNASATPDISYSPPPPIGTELSSKYSGITTTLIGTPRQTAQGCTFSVLLDPRLAVKLPYMRVRLAYTQIAMLMAEIGSTVVAPLTDLTFIVAQVRHSGDTRGNEWTTEVTGVSSAYGDGILTMNFGVNSSS